MQRSKRVGRLVPDRRRPRHPNRFQRDPVVILRVKQDRHRPINARRIPRVGACQLGRALSYVNISTRPNGVGRRPVRHEALQRLVIDHQPVKAERFQHQVERIKTILRFIIRERVTDPENLALLKAILDEVERSRDCHHAALS